MRLWLSLMWAMLAVQFDKEARKHLTDRGHW
jgi:hypothetical protein